GAAERAAGADGPPTGRSPRAPPAGSRRRAAAGRVRRRDDDGPAERLRAATQRSAWGRSRPADAAVRGPARPGGSAAGHRAAVAAGVHGGLRGRGLPGAGGAGRGRPVLGVARPAGGVPGRAPGRLRAPRDRPAGAPDRDRGEAGGAPPVPRPREPRGGRGNPRAREGCRGAHHPAGRGREADAPAGVPGGPEEPKEAHVRLAPRFALRGDELPGG
ncbi:unnamed protein product, partial [Prorocentrum cordatum]